LGSASLKCIRLDTDIPDGTSNTLLVGEKHVPRNRLGQGFWDSSLYNGESYSSRRSAGPFYPLAQSPDDQGWLFGSDHPGICHFVFCDGHVQMLHNTIDPKVLGLLANRADGQAIPDY
jgi:prepilin-type processing-associated H-X9-DG protein